MGTSESAQRLRAEIERHHDDLVRVLTRYGAVNPRIFGSVARGDATERSDVDVLVDLVPGKGNPLMRVAGIGEELSEILGVKVEVVSDELLRVPVAATALRDAVAI